MENASLIDDNGQTFIAEAVNGNFIITEDETCNRRLAFENFEQTNRLSYLNYLRLHDDMV